MLSSLSRCHRIGQTKPVLVLRLVVPDTIDEAIVERAQSKRTLERLIIHNKQFKKSVESRQEWETVKKNTLSTAELLEIMKSRNYRHANKRVDASEENLSRILDRSDLWAQMATSRKENGANEDHKTMAVSSEVSNSSIDVDPVN